MWIRPGKPALVLAPMEGVTDAPMRALMSERGAFTYCVSEFLRVSQDVPPEKVFFHHIPELKKGCVTPAGIPIQIQLLGGNADRLAASAARACELGAQAIDINFGCPAPTVNRHDGGATLLKYPDRIREIVGAVRAAVPPHFPVSAKLRLGFDTLDAIYLNAERAAEGGASWITIHARTKAQGYAPPVHWKYIGEVRKNLSIPVVANGDIWNFEDFQRCQEITGCDHYMLGRGALANPSLSHQVARALGIDVSGTVGDLNPVLGTEAPEWRLWINRFVELIQVYSEHQKNAPEYTTRRIKQWIKMASLRREMPWFEQLKRAENLEQVFALLGPGT